MRKLFLGQVIIATVFIVVSISCSPNLENNIKYPQTDSRFNKDHNEQVTKIYLPEDYKFITEVDTDFIRITIIDLDKKNCAKFYRDNNFKPIDDTLPLTLACINYLDSAYRHLPSNNKMLINSGKVIQTYWTYLLDTSTCRLYCHISFPGYHGLTKLGAGYAPPELGPLDKKFELQLESSKK